MRAGGFSAITRWAALAVILAASLAGPARAEAPADTKPDEPPAKTSFRPPTPSPKDFDWIQLKSGEWLKGDITRMRDDTLEFDSDELDDLTFDWEDVTELHSARSNVYRLEGNLLVTGPAVIRGDVVRISEGGTERDFKREQLVAIVPAADTEWDHWSGKASLGVTLRSGNTDQTEISTTAWTRRETARSRLRFDYNASYGVLNGEENVNTHRALGKLDVYWTRNLYFTPASVEVFHDPFTNIGVRVSPSGGLGYHVFRGRFEWSLELGAGYQWTRFDSVETDEPESSSTGLLTFGSVLESEITKRIDFDLTYRLQLTVPDIDSTSHNMLGVLSVELRKHLDLDVSLTWDRVRSPQPLEDGSTPEQDDYRLVVGLALEF
jgi:hypothetical protein